MLLLLFAAAAPGKERAALQADLDSLATTLDSMLGHFEKAEGMADVVAQSRKGSARAVTLNQERTDGPQQGLVGGSWWDGGLLWVAQRLQDGTADVSWFPELLLGALMIKFHEEGYIEDKKELVNALKEELEKPGALKTLGAEIINSLTVGEGCLDGWSARGNSNNYDMTGHSDFPDPTGQWRTGNELPFYGVFPVLQTGLRANYYKKNPGKKLKELLDDITRSDFTSAWCDQALDDTNTYIE